MVVQGQRWMIPWCPSLLDVSCCGQIGSSGIGFCLPLSNNCNPLLSLCYFFLHKNGRSFRKRVKVARRHLTLFIFNTFEIYFSFLWLLWQPWTTCYSGTPKAYSLKKYLKSLPILRPSSGGMVKIDVIFNAKYKVCHVTEDLPICELRGRQLFS